MGEGLGEIGYGGRERVWEGIGCVGRVRWVRLKENSSFMFGMM